MPSETPCLSLRCGEGDSLCVTLMLASEVNSEAKG